MAKMTHKAIRKHKKNPNILLKIGGKPFRCDCGGNVFHHKDDDEIFICNSCKSEYDTSDRVY